MARPNWFALTAAVTLAYFLIRPDAQGDTNVDENDTNVGPKPTEDNVSRTPSVGELGIVDPTSQDVVGAFLYMIRASEHVFPRCRQRRSLFNFYGGVGSMISEIIPSLLAKSAASRYPKQYAKLQGYARDASAQLQALTKLLDRHGFVSETNTDSQTSEKTRKTQRRSIF